jgi:restriction system protein
MARKRGFFAELQHLNQQAEKNRRQQQAVAYRASVAAQREAESRLRASQRALAAAASANARERAQLEREAARLHVESQMADVESLNAELAQSREEIDGLLAAALAVDDYVDLESLKVTKVEHPPFQPGSVGAPTPPLLEPVYFPQPVYREPPVPGGMFGAKKKHAELIARARADYERAHRECYDKNTAIHAAHVAAMGRREEAERQRLARLIAADARYRAECQQREAEAEARNQEVTKLINDLAFDIEAAIREYVGIVLSNSVYPEAFPVNFDHDFDLATRELRLRVAVPPPSAVSVVKEYKYVKAKDEITSSVLPVKAQKDRYAGAVTQVALRTFHEIFEADRGGKIHSIALTVGTEALSPATGLPGTVPLVIVAADRETFRRFDLSNVIPQATLGHLGAAVSRSPFDLMPADTSHGVRIRKQ